MSLTFFDPIPAVSSRHYIGEIIFSGDPFSKSDLNYFLSCVYDLRSGGKKMSG